jgi:acetolactate synthase-1/2/3 large subunit
MTNRSVAHLVVDGLRRSGIDTLYCLPGVQNDDFFDVLFDARDITPVVTRHEQGASYLAMGAAQVTGKPSAFCVVPGPGMLNASAGLTSAYWGYARVLGIVGQIASHLQGRNVGTLHDMPDQTAVLRQVTKEAVVVSDPADGAALVQQAIDSLHSGIPRPVSLEVPVDVWAKPADGVIDDPTVTVPAIDPAEIERAAALLAKATCPLIVVGSGAYGASEEVAELAELIGAAVTTRRQGHGVVPTAHPHFIPLTAANRMWPEVDVVLGVGSRVEWPFGWGVDDNLSVIQLNIDPEEVNRHGFTEVGLVGDAAVGCRALIDAVSAVGTGPGGTDDATLARFARLRADFEDYTAHLEPQRSYTAAIRAAAPKETVLVEDVTQIGFASHLFYDHLAPRTFLTSGAAGTLGAGTAVAIGAAHAYDGPVVGIIGDGGFLFTATELATAAQYNIGVNLVVFNDGAYGNVKRFQQERYGPDRVIASTLVNPDFQQLASAFGFKSWRTDSPDGLRQALGQAIEHDGPTLVEVEVGEMPSPWPFFRMGPNRGDR